MISTITGIRQGADNGDPKIYLSEEAKRAANFFGLALSP